MSDRAVAEQTRSNISPAQGFPPVALASARVLILGSMPGQASLHAAEYYAHPRNQFWPIMGALFDAGPALPYSERLRQLEKHRIALWDVLASCHRPGSLDADIDPDTAVANDFVGFLRAHPHIHRICFNGAAAEQHFRRRVAATLADRNLECHRLPSTSPAHAGMGFSEKLERWRAGLL
jgi:double-stranded uracil-DNA glycosylase